LRGTGPFVRDKRESEFDAVFIGPRFVSTGGDLSGEQLPIKSEANANKVKREWCFIKWMTSGD
jgi:hypothetical protein